jgi:hypothetical protein
MSRATPNRRRRVLGLLALGALACGLTACEGEDTQPEAPAPAADVQLDTPLQAAGSLLSYLQRHLDAVAAGDRSIAVDTRDQIAWHIADREGVFRRHRQTAPLRPLDKAELLEGCAESWAAIIAYYDEIDLDGARPAVTSASRAVVEVPVAGPDDAARLQITCVRSAAGAWRVTALGFAGADGAQGSSAASAPARSAGE